MKGNGMEKIYTNRNLKKEFVFTLQFFNGNSGEQDMLVIKNEGDLQRADMYLHGLQLFGDTDFLTDDDREAFAAFCRAYLWKRNNSKNRRKRV